MLLTCYPNPKVEDKELFIKMLVKVFDGYSLEIGKQAVEKIVTERSPVFLPSIGVVKATCQGLQNWIDYQDHLRIKESQQEKIPDYSEEHKAKMKKRVENLLAGRFETKQLN